MEAFFLSKQRNVLFPTFVSMKELQVLLRTLQKLAECAQLVGHNITLMTTGWLL